MDRLSLPAQFIFVKTTFGCEPIFIVFLKIIQNSVLDNVLTQFFQIFDEPKGPSCHFMKYFLWNKGIKIFFMDTL